MNVVYIKHLAQIVAEKLSIGILMAIVVEIHLQAVSIARANAKKALPKKSGATGSNLYRSSKDTAVFYFLK